MAGLKEGEDGVEIFTGNGSNGGHMILAFCTFLLAEGRRNRIVEGGEPDRAAQERRTTLGHVILVSREVAGLSHGGIDARISDELFGRGETGDIAACRA